MLDSLTHYLHERRRGMTRAAGYVGAAYLITHYVRERLDDIRTAVLQDRLARENLRKRFTQNQEDAAFTVMTLLPTLAHHVLTGMDVEGVTQELQALSRPPRVPHPERNLLPPPKSSLASSVELLQDGRSEDGSVSISGVSSIPGDSAFSDLSVSSSSWVDQFSSVQSSHASREPSLSIPNPPVSEHALRINSPTLNGGAELSDSVTTTSSASSAAQATSKSVSDPPFGKSVCPCSVLIGILRGEAWILSTQSLPSRRLQVSFSSSLPESVLSDTMTSVTRTKAELWREVKLLTFTRTLTVIYSVTLLSLFTHIQLNIIGRAKYIQSVMQLEQDERMREDLESASILSLFWASGDDGDDAARPGEAEAIAEDTERKYLTLSWWILHVGWKDVGERVRRAVEEVFEGLSLKTKLGIVDVHRLISDVRRRVEYEVTFEGKERRINFMSTLLPPTPETLQHVLTQGGIPQRSAIAPDARFSELIAEMRTYLHSASFARVLEVSLDHTTEVLLVGVQKHVFGDAPGGSERLAAMLPGLARWCHLALEGLPNGLVDGLASLREVEALSAIIYSDYAERLR
ncbi:Peroxin-3 [Sparassis latifolia]